MRMVQVCVQGPSIPLRCATLPGKCFYWLDSRQGGCQFQGAGPLPRIPRRQARAAAGLDCTGGSRYGGGDCSHHFHTNTAWQHCTKATARCTPSAQIPIACLRCHSTPRRVSDAAANPEAAAAAESTAYRHSAERPLKRGAWPRLGTRLGHQLHSERSRGRGSARARQGARQCEAAAASCD